LRVKLGAAVLRLADHRRAHAQAAVTARRGRNANAVDIAGWHAHRARQADKQRAQIAAFAAEVAGLEHRLDVAPAAAAHLGIAERVVDDPFVDRARLFDVAARSFHDAARGVLHDAVGGDPLGRRSVEDTLRRAQRFCMRIGAADIDRPVARGELAGELEARRAMTRRPLRVQHRDAILAVTQDLGACGVAAPRAAEAALPLGVGGERQRQPNSRHALRKIDFGPRSDLETAPLRLRKSDSPRQNGGCSAGYEGSTVHGRSLEVRRNLEELRKAGRAQRGGGRQTRNAPAGRPRASPRPRPELDWAKPIITASERELRTPAAPGSAWRVLYSKKKPGRARACDLRNDYLLALPVSFFSPALAF